MRKTNKKIRRKKRSTKKQYKKNGRNNIKRNSQREKEHRSALWKKIALFIIFQIIFTAVSMPFLVFYGPFDNVKKTIVGTSWATWKHQYIAKFFLSDKAIEKIVGNEFAVNPAENGEKIQDLDINKVSSDKIEVINIDGGVFSGKLMVVHDPARIEVGYSSKLPDEGQPTSFIAKENNAVAAINAGGLIDKNWTGIGKPYGVIIKDEKVVFNNIEQGNKTEIVGFRKNGMLVVGEYSLDNLREMGIKEAITFGPTLILNGKPTIKGNNDGGWGIAPRTAIGQRIDGSVLLLVIDGRSLKSGAGATLRDVQDILYANGAINAANLDGGSSTTMYYKGEVINNPSDGLGQRSVPSIFMVMPGKGGQQ